jgi:hypothetical protein
MKILFLLLTSLAVSAQSDNLFLTRQAPLDLQPIPRAWKVSALALAGASALDVASSWGKCCERNPLLAASDRRFGTRAVAIKSGALGGQLLLQYFAVKKSPKLAKVLSVVNFAGAGALTYVAVHNFQVPRR